MGNDKKWNDTTDEKMWTDVIDGATETLDVLQKQFHGDPNLGLAAVALAMSYLLVIAKTPEDRRKALYECVEERVGEAKVSTSSIHMMFEHGSSSKVVH
jgi:translation initiation factor 6 (eIF-6)